MNVLINLDKMQFLHKHESMIVLDNLTWIEVVDDSTLIAPITNGEFLFHLTHFEKKLLFKNTVEFDTMYAGANLDALLIDLANALPVSNVNSIWVAAQMHCIPEDNEQQYLFSPKTKKPVLGQAEPVRIIWDRNNVPSPESLEAIKENFVEVIPMLSSTLRERAVSVRTKNIGGSVDKIRQLSLEMWETAGKPTKQSDLKSLKSAIIIRAVEQGLNVNTARRQATEWLNSKIT